MSKATNESTCTSCIKQTRIIPHFTQSKHDLKTGTKAQVSYFQEKNPGYKRFKLIKDKLTIQEESFGVKTEARFSS